MSLTLVTAPAEEPVSLAEMKAWLRLDGADEDDVLAAVIATARAAVEARSGRRLVAQGWRWALDRWPPAPVLQLPVSPVRAIDAVRVRDAAGAAVSLPASAWQLDAASDPARLALLAAVPAPGRPLAGIEIDIAAGYGAPAAVPPALKLAVRLTAARLFENRGEQPDEGELPALPATAGALVGPFRLRRL
jgi:uncharacterized phiE125 gp8 family phage protein